MRCFKFNMVEIALAIAVISIGLSAVLVLFPVGINATRAAMDENSCGDAAEYITRYIRGQFLAGWNSNGTQSSFSGFADNSYQTSDPEGGFTWNSTAVTNFPDLCKATNSGLNGVYKFVKTGASGEEVFSAVVKVWMPSGNPADLVTAASSASSACPLYVPDTANGNTPKLVKTGEIELSDGSTPVQFGSIAQSVLVEISWPADLPAAERLNRRVFRVDVYNPYYQIAP